MAVAASGPCPVCGVSSSSRCAGCYAVFYCGAEHQKQHWKRPQDGHKEACKKPFKIEKTKDLGR